MGCDADRYAEEAKAARTVSEVYSAPRVTRAAKLLPSLGVLPGFALDLSTCDEEGRAWDFDEEDRREAARELIRTKRPKLVVGSPMCTDFC